MNMASTYWVDLIRTEVRLVRGRYTTRVISAGEGPPLRPAGERRVLLRMLGAVHRRCSLR